MLAKLASLSGNGADTKSTLRRVCMSPEHRGFRLAVQATKMNFKTCLLSLNSYVSWVLVWQCSANCVDDDRALNDVLRSIPCAALHMAGVDILLAVGPKRRFKLRRGLLIALFAVVC